MRKRPIKIVISGGGSGGHTTPLIAISRELRHLLPECKIIFVGQRGDRFFQSVKSCVFVDKSHAIFAGKLRRYNGVKLYNYKIREHVKNFRDLIYIFLGFFQSLYIFLRYRPKVFFSKGGYTSLDPGLVAALFHVPIVTHDSDSVPGLTNRVLRRWAKYKAIGVAVDKEGYEFTGVPIRHEFLPVTDKTRIEAKKNLRIKARMVLVTGGGLGSGAVNDMVFAAAPEITEVASLWHHVGTKHYETMVARYKAAGIKRVKVIEHIENMAEVMTAADLIITRAGTTAIAEIAALAKPSIIIPSPILAEGHQTKNAEFFEAAGAAVVVQEADGLADATILSKAVKDIIKSKSHRLALSEQMSKYAVPDAAKKIAELIIKAIK